MELVFNFMLNAIVENYVRIGTGPTSQIIKNFYLHEYCYQGKGIGLLLAPPLLLQ